MGLIIRDAVPNDAEAGCQVMRRSIAELCAADHKNDPGILGGWLRNKTPEFFEAWIAQPGNSLLVASEGKQIVAVGLVTGSGQITLNYVSPDARFRGVSKALLAALEARAILRGCMSCILNSTETARRFYLSNGYAELGLPTDGTRSTYPMSKKLDTTL